MHGARAGIHSRHTARHTPPATATSPTRTVPPLSRSFSPSRTVPSRPVARRHPSASHAALRAAALCRSRVARLALGWLLLCLALVPVLGQMHHVAHGGPAWQALAVHPVLHAHPADGAHAHAAQEALAPHAVAHSGVHSGVHSAADLWGQGVASLPGGLLPGHAAADCQLLDQLTLADALHLVAAFVSAATPAAAIPPGGTLGRPAQPPALFEARGPPHA